MDFRGLLEEVACCPICLEILKPPVVMCVSGHGICSKCKGPLTSCPVCRKGFLTNKPRILNEILQVFIKNPLCKYSKEGCKEGILDDHEKYCHFRPITCMIGKGNPTWSGPINAWAMCVHISAKYKLNTPGFLHYNKFQNITNENYIHSVDNQLFLLKTAKKNQHFHQTVFHIPLKKPTHTYYFSIEFEEKGNTVFKYRIKANIFHEDDQIENSIYCMSVPVEALHAMINSNGDLPVTFTCHKN